MSLHEYLDVNNIKIPLQGDATEEVVAELMELLVQSGKVSDRGEAIDAVLEREAKGSTGIGGGIALPHTKLGSIADLTIALGISRDGVDFDARDRKPVHVVLLMLANANEPGKHVFALKDAANLLSMPQFFKRLIDARTSQEACDLIRAEED